MTLQEILKAIGLSEEQIAKVLGDMKANKIFTAGEENLDTRYSKLKSDNDSVEKQLKEANELITGLKTQFPGNFASREEIGIQEHRLESGNAGNENSEPKTLSEALRMQFENKE